MNKKFFHPRAEELQLTEVLAALGDPVRLEILANIWRQGSLSCSEACTMGLPKSTMSHHFRILRESGLVLTKKLGVSHSNTLREHELNRRFPGLLAAIFSGLGNTPKKRSKNRQSKQPTKRSTKWSKKSH